MTHTETVQQIYAAFFRGDIAFILAQLAPDVAWDQGLDVPVPWLQPGHGVAHVASFLKVVGEQLAFDRFEIQNVLAGGDQVVALVAVSVRVLPTGKRADDYEAHVWTFGKDGKVVAFRHLVDTHKHVSVARP